MPAVYHENRSQIQMVLGENDPGTDPCSRPEGARLKRLSQMCSAGSALPTTADLLSSWLAVKPDIQEMAEANEKGLEC